MKIHALALLPASPPAVPQKAPPTALETEQKTEEFVQAAERQRFERNRLIGSRKNPRHQDQETDANPDEPDRHEHPGSVDILA